MSAMTDSAGSTLQSAVADIEPAAATKLSVIADECLAQSNYNREKAIQLLQSRAADDPVLARAIIASASRYFIRQAEFFTRQKLRVVPNKDDASGLQAVARLQMRWLDMELLPNGVRLGDALQVDLKHAIETKHDEIKGLKRNAAFYSEIMRKLPVNKRVRDQFTDKQLERLWENLS